MKSEGSVPLHTGHGDLARESFHSRVTTSSCVHAIRAELRTVSAAGSRISPATEGLRRRRNDNRRQRTMVLYSA